MSAKHGVSLEHLDMGLSQKLGDVIEHIQADSTFISVGIDGVQSRRSS